MKTVEVSQSALESLQKMVEQLQDERDELLASMHEILRIHANDSHRPEAFSIARDSIAKCTAKPEVLE